MWIRNLIILRYSVHIKKIQAIKQVQINTKVPRYPMTHKYNSRKLLIHT